jgi:hypothetical protein
MPTPTTDFSIFDAIELVSYSPGSGSSVPNVRAVRRPLTQSSQRNIQRFVQLQGSDVVFHLDAAPLASTTLSLTAGDSVVDANGNFYGVLFFERQTLNNTVLVVCRPT